MEGIIYNENFLDSHGELFEVLMKNTIWDESMLNRKTASYGKPYNYSQMQYQFQEFTREITEVIENIEELLGFRPNNCLINYYETGSSKMGYHSDQMDILEEGTGVVIISVGEARTLRFRNIKDKSNTIDFNLIPGSLLYMNNDLQNLWQHALIKSNTKKGRMSLTFRKLN